MWEAGFDSRWDRQISMFELYIMTTQDLYKNNIEVLKKLDIQFKECTSEPVLSYETAEKVRKEFGLTGIESKSLFLKGKDGKYYMLVSVEGKRADFDRLKQVTATKISVASQEELKEKTGCDPHCAVPFGYPSEITLLINPEIYNSKKFIFSPGPPEKTIEIDTKDIDLILEALPNNKIKLLSSPHQ